MEPGELIAKGRDADIFEYGHGRVLKRSRRAIPLGAEARIMTYVRDRGYPVPEVLELSEDGRDLVMERVNGPTMIDAVASRPWRLKGFGRELGELHRLLHELPAPEGMRAAPCGSGTALLHLDLHPLNVLVTKSGPVVIDWANACAGDPAVDVALTWALLSSGEVTDGGVRELLVNRARGAFLRSFLACFDLAEVREVLSGVVEWKCADENLSKVETDRMHKLAEAIAP